MGAKITTGKMAQDSKPTTLKEWRCHHCPLTNEEDMSLLFLEILLRLEPVSIAETCIFHQVIEAQIHCLLCLSESLSFQCSG